jgi:hypothetical protein
MSVNKNGNGIVSPHPDHDEEREYQLCRMEMKKIRAAQEKKAQEAESRRERRINACDLTGQEFAIVCEELWVDFKTWVNHNENMKNCVAKTRSTFSKNLILIMFAIALIIGFRWYMGGGKEACAKFSVAGVVLSFVCELFRYLGEAFLGMFLGIIGFCIGILPLIACVCIFESKNAFPDPLPEAEETTEHEKKD